MFVRMTKWVYRRVKVYLGLLNPTSKIKKIKLAAAEKFLLGYLETPYKTQHVNIGPIVGKRDCKIWTLSMNENSEKTPIVLIHGLCQGIGNWTLNFDAIAAGRPLYAFDVPGFGQSSKLYFSTKAQKTEKQLVDCIEAWRKEMKLEKFILLGFSMGGFLATSYAFRYPNRLLHLILVDPWGFPKRPNGKDLYFEPSLQSATVPLSLATTVHLLKIVFHSNPYYLLMRVVGMMSMGKEIVTVSFPYLAKFSVLGKNGIRKAAEYIFHCNSQIPTGLVAFISMSSKSGVLWAKFPMSDRISFLDKKVAITFVYGTKSWLYKSPTSDIQKMRPTSYVDEQLIEGANHDCNVWESDIFNKIVTKVCDWWDSNKFRDNVIIPGSISSPTLFSQGENFR